MAGRVKDVVSRGVRNVSDVMEHPLIEIAVAYTALLSVVIVLVELFMPLTPEARIRLYLVDLAIVMVLTVDFLYRAHKSGDPIGYIKRNAYEIPALIPAGLIAMIEYHLIGFGFVRLIRLVRVVRLALLLTRGSRLVKILKQTENRVDFIGLLGAVSLTIMFGALAVYIAESPYPESPIKDLWTAFWWGRNQHHSWLRRRSPCDAPREGYWSTHDDTGHKRPEHSHRHPRHHIPPGCTTQREREGGQDNRGYM